MEKPKIYEFLFVEIMFITFVSVSIHSFYTKIFNFKYLSVTYNVYHIMLMYNVYYILFLECIVLIFFSEILVRFASRKMHLTLKTKI